MTQNRCVIRQHRLSDLEPVLARYQLRAAIGTDGKNFTLDHTMHPALVEPCIERHFQRRPVE